MTHRAGEANHERDVRQTLRPGTVLLGHPAVDDLRARCGDAARREVIGNYRDFTRPGGLNAFAVFVDKPFVPRAPDAESTAHRWISGELLGHYWDWRIEYCDENVFDCTSSGVPHQHAMCRMIARKL